MQKTVLFSRLWRDDSPKRYQQPYAHAELRCPVNKSVMKEKSPVVVILTGIFPDLASVQVGAFSFRVVQRRYTLMGVALRHVDFGPFLDQWLCQIPLYCWAVWQAAAPVPFLDEPRRASMLHCVPSWCSVGQVLYMHFWFTTLSMCSLCMGLQKFLANGSSVFCW